MKTKNKKSNRKECRQDITTTFIRIRIKLNTTNKSMNNITPATINSYIT